ncbi:Paladin protein [Nymphaea thermarum]|nr:Paladin protein [Nymphaea thermarum]
MTMTVQREPERVMNHRGGSVLGRKTILKSDHFPGCQNYRLMPQIEGAPNYRQAGSSHVHGVAIPTIDGIHNVLDHIGAQKNGEQKQVLWINLREEPVVYINGRPFVLREVERPFSNLEYTGINRVRVEQMEARLKEDIILEASRYENKILVTDELPDGQMVDQWEPVTQESIKTPLEVYEELQAEGYLVDYERVPITDEKSPKERDFDMLVHRILQADINAEIVFNCQMGRGRTTTGMVIATLVYLKRIGASGISRSNSIGKVLDGGAHVIDNVPKSEEAMLRGEYAVIRSLIRVLEGGIECKRQVDKVIDSCASMQNLREAIATYRNSILRQRDEMKREAALSFFMEYLERYYFLICFSVYLHTERSALLPNGSSQNNFVDWMRARPELYSILRRLLRRDPMGALGYTTSKTYLVKITSSPDDHPCNLGVVAAMRKGEVLGRQTVLKSDHCPGCQNLTLPERVEGAPNFRDIPGFPVYGVANPTIDGIRAVIQRIASRNGSCPILWHNMREEPVVYINGKPFVLREVERPYKNMLEYTGIDRERVERMEARLKEDILREAELYGGTIMVIHESDDGQIFDLWEHVNSEVVQTPLEVFKSLETEGLPVKYARVPITDGKAPKSSDFDTLAINIASAPKNAACVFNCQMGQGRTTTGTVIACLVKLRIDFGRPIRVPHEVVSHEEIDSGSSSCEEAGNESAPGASESMRAKHGNKLHHTFGINDILLLRKVTRLFDNGIECREVLDAVIDRCAAMQNIRKAVLKYRKVFNHQNVEPRVRRVALNRGAEYLERYFRMIAFAAYVGSEAFDGFCGQGESRITFKTWVHRMPEVQAMKWSIRLRPGRFFNIPVELRTPHESDHGDAVMEALVNTRSGSVLGKGSILKMYFYPGQRTSSCMQIPGAPHVYKVDAYPVYSMATPTIAGAKELLKLLGAKSIGPGRTGKKVVVTDLREEAVVYINGVPFVLRELDQAVDTLKHVGITGPVVEHMEVRLKEDIITEITQSGGRMLLHREELNPSSKHPNVIGYWENVLLDDVKTPAEVYAALSYEGYNIKYRRIPLTREREALAADVDAIQSCLDSSAGYYLYVSHMGFGGVAYAMAITSLRLRADELSQSERSELLDRKHRTLVGQEQLPKSLDEEEPFVHGDYRDILSLTRVLMYGPQSKAEVDAIIDRCAGAGNLRDDILHYRKELQKCSDIDDENMAYLMDMGIKALRRYFYLIAFRSYLFTTVKTTGTNESRFTSWMEARPELGHLCDNLRLDK